MINSKMEIKLHIIILLRRLDEAGAIIASVDVAAVSRLNGLVVGIAGLRKSDRFLVIAGVFQAHAHAIAYP